MPKLEPSVVFNEKVAANYDKRAEAWAAGSESLQSLMRVILAPLPAQSSILCVGVGTGTELIALAQAFPDWHFTAVEPAPAMLEVCRRRVEECGLTARCTFHGDYLDSLPAAAPFDAATCLLVSHFFMVPEERSAFFHQIASRLETGGILINSDLTSDMSLPQYQNLLEVWVRMLRTPEMSDDQIEKWRAAYGKEAALLPPRDVEAILVAGGFAEPTLFFQNLLIHAWFSRRAAL